MWRHGILSHATIDPRSDGAVILWFVNGHQMGRREFDNWTSALDWSARLQTQNWTAGWRLTPE